MFSHWRHHTSRSWARALLLLATAGPASSQDLLGSRVNGLMTFDFSDNYITPRGLHVEDEGLVTQPLWCSSFWKLNPRIRERSPTSRWRPGVEQLSFGRAGVNPSRWNEVDPILGLTVKFRKGLHRRCGDHRLLHANRLVRRRPRTPTSS